MEHKGTHRIETERLLLRKYKITDAEDMFLNWASSTAVTRFLTWEPYRRTTDVRAYIKNRMESYSNKNVYDWVIEWKENHQVIGDISVVKFNEETKTAEIGYCLGEAYWHKGIMTEALRAVIRYLIREVGVETIIGCHDTRNVCSGKVMEKCGLKYTETVEQEFPRTQELIQVDIRTLQRKDYLSS